MQIFIKNELYKIYSLFFCCCKMNFSKMSSFPAAGIKLEPNYEINNEISNAQLDATDIDDTREIFNSALVEDLSSNEKILSDISRFIADNRDKLNKKNLVNYCGILDPCNNNN